MRHCAYSTFAPKNTYLDWVTGLELQYFFDVNRPTVIISQTQLVYNPAVEQPSLMRSKQYSVSAAHNRLSIGRAHMSYTCAYASFRTRRIEQELCL
mmetsp:Transcript_31049/g.55602  ORF Transcript_31049/g.55602 Transcript_31049/m.55602 type:complete len:96 (-) Transcript_31049:200-487(-)